VLILKFRLAWQVGGLPGQQTAPQPVNKVYKGLYTLNKAIWHITNIILLKYNGTNNSLLYIILKGRGANLLCFEMVIDYR
jgi:hypothetical protein